MSSPTPDEVREALASASRMTRAGQDRGRWPRWAAAIDAIGGGLLTVGFAYLLGLLVTEASGTVALTWALAGLSLPGIWFRFYWRRKSGVLAAFTGRDLLAGVLVVAGIAGSAYAFQTWSVIWPAWVVGAAYAVDLYSRRRRRVACPVIDHG